MPLQLPHEQVEETLLSDLWLRQEQDSYHTFERVKFLHPGFTGAVNKY